MLVAASVLPKADVLAECLEVVVCLVLVKTPLVVKPPLPSEDVTLVSVSVLAEASAVGPPEMLFAALVMLKSGVLVEVLEVVACPVVLVPGRCRFEQNVCAE